MHIPDVKISRVKNFFEAIMVFGKQALLNKKLLITKHIVCSYLVFVYISNCSLITSIKT